MPALFKQDDFSGGLFTQFDAAKSPDGKYPLLVDARTRSGMVSPTKKHVKLSAPSGKKQGIFSAGEYTIVFIAGNAYYAKIVDDVIVFQPINTWTPMSATVDRISATLVPVTTNFFNRTGEPELVEQVFNSAIATMPQALFCFDGSNQCQAILPDGTARVLQTYEEWTKNHPEYVPVGDLPAVVGNKLFLASPDRRRVYHSVSGRVSDFVVNLVDPTGEKGGDAETVAAAVSYNEITALRPLSSGHVFVGTLYGSFVLQLDYNETFFGEPYLKPVGPLFPTGPVNEISMVDIIREGLQDTAFIAQSGIHSFNAVAQTQSESNNYPLGAKIRGLLVNPQERTCAALYDDYAFFAVNTIHGYGVFVYDTTNDEFQSLDLSFGRVKQFAVAKLQGQERLFFITSDDAVYEAFADTEKNPARIYLGDWTPEQAGAEFVITGITAMFANVKSSGQAKFSIYANRVRMASSIEEVTASEISTAIPLPLPYAEADTVCYAGFDLNKAAKGWRIGAMIEWNFDGDLSDVCFEGTTEVSGNTQMKPSSFVQGEEFVFIADSGYYGELCPGGVYNSAEIVVVEVTQGEYYAFDGNDDQILSNGKEQLIYGVFLAKSDHVTIKGTDGQPVDFNLRPADDYIRLLNHLHTLNKPIIHGGDFGYPNGTLKEVLLSKYPIRVPIFGATPGNHDVTTASGANFYAKLNVAKHYSKDSELASFFFYNSSGVEPHGIDENSQQADILRLWAATNTKRFKFVITHKPAYTNDINHSPGLTDLRWIKKAIGVHAMFSGHAHSMERFVVDDFPHFICGAGGQPLRGYTAATANDYAFRNNTSIGYIHLLIDHLTTRVLFKDYTGKVLDSYAVYA